MGRINNQILGVIGFILHFNPGQKVTQLPPQPLEDHEGYKDSDFLFNSALTLLKRERVFFFLVLQKRRRSCKISWFASAQAVDVCYKAAYSTRGSTTLFFFFYFQALVFSRVFVTAKTTGPQLDALCNRVRKFQWRESTVKQHFHFLICFIK